MPFNLNQSSQVERKLEAYSHPSFLILPSSWTPSIKLRPQVGTIDIIMFKIKFLSDVLLCEVVQQKLPANQPSSIINAGMLACLFHGCWIIEKCFI
ncbi:hypothetical protein PISMIDRAFT_684814, partial [Pisolithus microcarpus 441]